MNETSTAGSFLLELVHSLNTMPPNKEERVQLVGLEETNEDGGRERSRDKPNTTQVATHSPLSLNKSTPEDNQTSSLTLSGIGSNSSKQTPSESSSKQTSSLGSLSMLKETSALIKEEVGLSNSHKETAKHNALRKRKEASVSVIFRIRGRNAPGQFDSVKELKESDVQEVQVLYIRRSERETDRYVYYFCWPVFEANSVLTCEWVFVSYD